MDTRTFLKAILPERGIKFVQRIRPRPGKKDATILYPVADYEEAAAKSHELDIQYANDNIYYAMASYKEAKSKTVQTKDGKDFTYVVGRTQENALAVKSLWFDLDVGKPGAYSTQREAAAGVLKYALATGLPTPVILSSGYGVHCYWVFTEEIDAAAAAAEASAPENLDYQHGEPREFLDKDGNPYDPETINRNAQCPCGSGFKFKTCHGRLL